MDYMTKATNRNALRQFSKIVRRIFGCESDEEQFPVLNALEKIPDIVDGTTFEIVDDNVLSPQIFAQCFPNPNGGFKIEIKKTVYDGAYDGNAAFLSFICHEICHVLLFQIGFTPITTRAFNDNEIEPFRSVEWQAKALCGEIQIPYEATIGMNAKDIMKKYNVTKASACYRVKMDKKKK